MSRVSIITVTSTVQEEREAVAASIRHAALGRSLVVKAEAKEVTSAEIVRTINEAVKKVKRDHLGCHFIVLADAYDMLDVGRLRPLFVRYERIEQPKLFSLRHPRFGPMWCAWDIRARINFVLPDGARKPFLRDQVSTINLDPRASYDRIECDYGFLT
jgi:hypothetical protein